MLIQLLFLVFQDHITLILMIHQLEKRLNMISLRTLMQEDNIKNVKSLDYFSKLKKPLPRLKKQRESKKKWKDS